MTPRLLDCAIVLAAASPMPSSKKRRSKALPPVTAMERRRVPLSLEAYERMALLRALDERDYHVGDAAALLGLSGASMYRKMVQRGIPRREPGARNAMRVRAWYLRTKEPVSLAAYERLAEPLAKVVQRFGEGVLARVVRGEREFADQARQIEGLDRDESIPAGRREPGEFLVEFGGRISVLQDELAIRGGELHDGVARTRSVSHAVGKCRRAAATSGAGAAPRSPRVSKASGVMPVLRRTLRSPGPARGSLNEWRNLAARRHARPRRRCQ